MRLINTSTFELRQEEHSSFVKQGYAILSHRWEREEVELPEYPQHIGSLQQDQNLLARPGRFNKIRGACRLARLRNIQWMWIDTCCIDRANAVEYSEAVNSMFRWYRGAKVCFAYLNDVQSAPKKQGVDVFRSSNSEHDYSIWFSRGWTLQELLAPQNLEFYDAQWQLIGTKKDLAPALQQITRIKTTYLSGEEDFQDACAAAKMSWQAGRQVSEPEDIAYSMLGLFGITMQPLYGEGAEASFLRLQSEYMSKKADETLFAWKMPAEGPGMSTRPPKVYGEILLKEDEWGLLAPSPEWFRYAGNVTNKPPKRGFVARKHGGFSSLQQGILSPLTVTRGTYACRIIGAALTGTLILTIPAGIYLIVECRYTSNRIPLNAWEPNEKGKLKVIHLHLRRKYTSYVRIKSQEYYLGSGKPAPSWGEKPLLVLQPEARN